MSVTCRKGKNGQKYYRDKTGPISASEGRATLGEKCQGLSKAAKLESACERLAGPTSSPKKAMKKPSPKKSPMAKKTRKPAAKKSSPKTSMAAKKSMKPVAKKDMVYIWSVRSKNIDGEKMIIPYLPVTELAPSTITSARAISKIYRDAKLPAGSLMMTDYENHKAIKSFVSLRKNWTREQWKAFSKAVYPSMMSNIQVFSLDGPQFELYESDYVARMESRPTRPSASKDRVGSDSRRTRPMMDRRRNYLWTVYTKRGVIIPSNFVGAVTDEQMGDRSYLDSIRKDLRSKGILGSLVSVGKETQMEIAELFRRAEDWTVDNWRAFWESNEGLLDSFNYLLKDGWAKDIGVDYNRPAARQFGGVRPRSIRSPAGTPVPPARSPFRSASAPRAPSRSPAAGTPARESISEFLFGASPARSSNSRSAILSPPREPLFGASPSPARPSRSIRPSTPLRENESPGRNGVSPWKFTDKPSKEGWVWKTENSGWLFGKNYPKTLLGKVSGNVFDPDADEFLNSPDVAYLLRDRPASGPYVYVRDPYLQRGLEEFIASGDVQSFRAHYDKNQAGATQLGWDY